MINGDLIHYNDSELFWLVIRYQQIFVCQNISQFATISKRFISYCVHIYFIGKQIVT